MFYPLEIIFIMRVAFKNHQKYEHLTNRTKTIESRSSQETTFFTRNHHQNLQNDQLYKNSSNQPQHTEFLPYPGLLSVPLPATQSTNHRTDFLSQQPNPQGRDLVVGVGVFICGFRCRKFFVRWKKFGILWLIG